MRSTYYSYSKRLLAYILLWSLLLQSCHNPSNPLPSQPPIPETQSDQPIPNSCPSHVEEKTDQSTKEEHTRQAFGKISQNIQDLRSAFENLQAQIPSIDLQNATSHKDLQKRHQNLLGIKDDLEKQLTALDSLYYIDDATRASRKVLLNNTNQLLDNELEILLKEVHQKLTNLPQQGTEHSGEPAPTASSDENQKAKEEWSKREFDQISQKVTDIEYDLTNLKPQIHNINLRSVTAQEWLSKHIQVLRSCL